MSIIPPHDPLCPMAVGPAFANSGPLAYCQCDLIAKARADEQERHAVLREQLAYEQRAHLAHDNEMADLHAKILDLRYDYVDGDRVLFEDDVLALIGGGE